MFGPCLNPRQPPDSGRWPNRLRRPSASNTATLISVWTMSPKRQASRRAIFSGSSARGKARAFARCCYERGWSALANSSKAAAPTRFRPLREWSDTGRRADSDRRSSDSGAFSPAAFGGHGTATLNMTQPSDAPRRATTSPEPFGRTAPTGAPRARHRPHRHSGRESTARRRNRPSSSTR